MQNTEIYQSGNRIYIPQGADLPCRCVRCNAVVEGEPKSRMFRYLTGLTGYPNQKASARNKWKILLFIVLLSEICLLDKNKWFGAVLLTFVIGVSFVFDKVKLSPSLCKKHKDIRMLLMAFSYTLLIFGVLFVFAELFDQSGAYPFSTIGVTMIVIAFVSDIAFSRHITILRVLYVTNENEIVVGNVGAVFRNNFRKKDKSAEIYRSGNWIYIPQGADLPCRCVRCNAVVEDEPKSRTFRYLTGTDKYGRAVYPNQKLGARSMWPTWMFIIFMAEMFFFGKNADGLLGATFLTILFGSQFMFYAVKLSPLLCKKHNVIRILLTTINFILLIFGVFQVFVWLFLYKSVAYPFFTVGMVMVGIAFVSDIAFCRHINILNVLYETNDNESVIDGVGEEFRNNFRGKSRRNQRMS